MTQIYDIYRKGKHPLLVNFSGVSPILLGLVFESYSTLPVHWWDWNQGWVIFEQSEQMVISIYIKQWTCVSNSQITFCVGLMWKKTLKKLSKLEKRKILADNWKEKSKPGKEFPEYMVKYKKDMMKASIIASVPEKRGLGKPSAEYSYKKLQWVNQP